MSNNIPTTPSVISAPPLHVTGKGKGYNSVYIPNYLPGIQGQATALLAQLEAQKDGFSAASPPVLTVLLPGQPGTSQPP